jgi:hypothetical protein
LAGTAAGAHRQDQRHPVAAANPCKRPCEKAGVALAAIILPAGMIPCEKPLIRIFYGRGEGWFMQGI